MTTIVTFTAPILFVDVTEFDETKKLEYFIKVIKLNSKVSKNYIAKPLNLY